MRVAFAAAGGILAASCLTSIGDVQERPADASAGAGGAAGSSGGASGSGGSSGSAGTGGSGGQDAAPDVTPIPGLIGHWPFDDGSGSTAVDVIAGRNAVLPDQGTSWTSAGAIGGALTLAAPEDPLRVVEWDGAAFPATGTITVWVRMQVIPNDTTSRGIFDNWNGALNHLFLRRGNSNPALELQCAFQVANAPYAWAKGVPIASNVWQLVAIGWSPSFGFCYAHGTRDEGPANPGWAPSDQTFEVGENLDGTIDDLRLYDYLLSDEDLAELLLQGP
jgi:hypothetical protein